MEQNITTISHEELWKLYEEMVKFIEYLEQYEQKIKELGEKDA